MSEKKKKLKLKAVELTLYAMLGALMYCGDVFMEALPNIHFVGVLTVTYTAVFRKKALIPIYLYVLVTLLLSGFSLWTLPYLYIWTILWGLAMLVPRKAPIAVKCIVYPVICTLHGLFFGILYAPMQAIMFGYDFEEMLKWIYTGLTFDAIHAVSNLAGGLLIMPIVLVLERFKKIAKI